MLGMNLRHETATEHTSIANAIEDKLQSRDCGDGNAIHWKPRHLHHAAYGSYLQSGFPPLRGACLTLTGQQVTKHGRRLSHCFVTTSQRRVSTWRKFGAPSSKGVRFLFWQPAAPTKYQKQLAKQETQMSEERLYIRVWAAAGHLAKPIEHSRSIATRFRLVCHTGRTWKVV